MSSSELHVVTGAFGYTGSHIAKLLLAEGKKVVTLTNSPHRKSPLQGQLEARPYSFTDLGKLTASLEGTSVLYNTYWVRFNDGTTSYDQAVRNSLLLFEAAKQAGVSRVVHVSIAHADTASPLAYYSSKGAVEHALVASGLHYSILQPAMFFGGTGILVNNIAWALRHLPVCAIFGKGEYKVQPIYVEDFAALAVAQGKETQSTIIPALGPDIFAYRDFVRLIAHAIGKHRPCIYIPSSLGYLAAKMIGLLMRDEFATKDEITGLMANLLCMPEGQVLGTTHFADWLTAHASTLGVKYASELARRRDTTKSY